MKWRSKIALRILTSVLLPPLAWWALCLATVAVFAAWNPRNQIPIDIAVSAVASKPFRIPIIAGLLFLPAFLVVTRKLSNSLPIIHGACRTVCLTGLCEAAILWLLAIDPLVKLSENMFSDDAQYAKVGLVVFQLCAWGADIILAIVMLVSFSAAIARLMDNR